MPDIGTKEKDLLLMVEQNTLVPFVSLVGMDPLKDAKFKRETELRSAISFYILIYRKTGHNPNKLPRLTIDLLRFVLTYRR